MIDKIDFKFMKSNFSSESLTQKWLQNVVSDKVQNCFSFRAIGLKIKLFR